MCEDIYGNFRVTMVHVMDNLVHQIETGSRSETGDKLYEHLRHRIKSDESMRKKLQESGLEMTTEKALRAITDSIGVRIVCLFIDDVYECIQRIRAFPNCTVVTEKDYIRNANPMAIAVIT